MRKRIAIIYTTFLRDQLMFKTLESIKKHWRTDFYLLVGDQNPDEFKRSWVRNVFSDADSIYAPMMFDCGVSKARNDLINLAKIATIPYCLITADSIAFTEKTVEKLDAAIDFMQNYDGLYSDREPGIVGFDLENRTPWEWRMDIREGAFWLSPLSGHSYYHKDDLLFQPCDICRQFFIAKTSVFDSCLWDPQLKTGDHEDFFWRFKKTPYRVWWTSDISGRYINSKPQEYLEYRNRQYREFRGVLLKKYGLSEWARYEGR